MKNHYFNYLKTFLSLCFLATLTTAAFAQVTHQVTVQNFEFVPQSLEINEGDIVEWNNVQGFHNINGTSETFPGNSESFGNETGLAEWTYSYTFSSAGEYSYQCDVHPGQMQGSITVVAALDCPDLEANIGDECDDGDANTDNDVVTEDCECEGEEPEVTENTALTCSDGIDNDGDGLIDCEEPECQGLPGDEGCTTCFNDGLSFADAVLDYNNPCPGNAQTDSSEALGVPDYDGQVGYVSLGDGGSLTLQFTNNTLVNSGDENPDLFIFEIGPLVEGTSIELRPLGSDTENELIAAGILDSDEDGFYEFGEVGGATSDVDIDSFFESTVGNTLFFDAIKLTDDGTNCSGSTPGADIDGVCALSSASCAIGASCDDGDENTINDVLNSECECEGELIEFDCPMLEVNIGDDCDDENSNTQNDVITDDCECLGTIVFDCPILEANFGDECDDEDADTENDIVTANCECEGEDIIVFDCPELEANIGDDCQTDEGFSGTISDNCVCVPDTSDGCNDYRFYLADHSFPEDISDLYEVVISDGEANLEYITTLDVEVHIAYNEVNNLIYAVAKDNGDLYTLNPNALNPTYSGPTSIDDADLTEITQAVFSQDGKLLVSSSDQDITYSIDVINGFAVSVFDSYSPIEGGDLAYAADGSALYMASREGNGNLFSVFPDDVLSDVLITDIDDVVTGLATMESGNLLLSAKGATELKVKDTDGNDVMSLPVLLDGESYTLRDGDMTAGCLAEGEPQNQDCDPIGECYAQSVVQYTEGTSFTGGSIAPGRTDATMALNEPQRADNLNFVSLGYGGSITLQFDGAVPNEEGDDIEIVETTYNNDNCDSYPEFADVWLSQNGIDFFFAKTICRSDNFVEIDNAGDFDCINFVRIENNGNLSDTPDAFDVDGAVAIHICDDLDNGDDENGEDGEVLVADLTSYPNPTTGQSQVVFTTAQTARTMVEVYDMNGRSVATLYNQVANEGQEYRLDFDGSDLPNGIYIYRLTTNNESIIEKFMIAR